MTRFTVRAHVDWTAEASATAVLLLRVAEAAHRWVLDEDLQVDNADVEDHGPRAGGGAGRFTARDVDGSGPPPLHGHGRGRPRPLRPGRHVADLGRARPRPAVVDVAEPLLPFRRAGADRRAPLDPPNAPPSCSKRSAAGSRPTSPTYPGRATCTPRPTRRRCCGGPGSAATSPTSRRRCCAVSVLPARVVSAYALDLEPQDFHAVVEAHDGAAWRLLDPTGLAPTGTLASDETGRDAADIAWGTTDGPLTLDRLEVAVART